MNGVESSQWAINIEVNNLDDISKLTQRLQNITQTASKLRPQLVSAVTEINKLTQAGTATSVMSSWTTLESKVNDTRRLAIQARREVSELRRQVEKGGGGAGIHLNQMSGSIAQAVAKGVQEGFRNAQIGTSFKGFEPPKTQADSREFYNKKFGIPFETADAYRTGDRKGTVPPGGRFAPLSGGSELQMMQLASNLLRAVVTDPIVRAINTLPSQLGHKIESQRDKEVTPRSPAAQAAAGDSPPQREQRAHREVNPIPAVDDARFERNKIAYSAKQLGMTPQELQSLSRQQIAERAVHTLNVPATARPAASTNMDARQSIAHVLAAKENPNETFGDFALRAATFNVATRGNNAATKQVLAKNFEAARAVAGDTPAAALAANRRTVQQVASLDDIDKGKNRSAATAVAQRLRTYTEAGAGEATAERLATQDAPRIRRAKNYAAGFGTPFRNDTIPSMAGTGEQREAIGSRLDPHLYDVHEKHIKPAIASGQLDPRSANSYYKFFLDKAIEEGVPGTHDLVGPRGGIKNSREGNTFKKQAALYRDIAIDSLKTPVAAQVAAVPVVTPPIVVPPVAPPAPAPPTRIQEAMDAATRLQESMKRESERQYGVTHFPGATAYDHAREKARLRVVYPQNYEHENIGASANAEEAYSRIARKHSVPIANVKSMVSGDLLSQANIAALSDADWKVYKKVVQDILVHAKKLDLAIAEQARTLGAPAVIRSFAIRNKPYPNVMQSAFPVGAELITPADVLAGPHREISSVRAPGSMGDRKASLGTRWLDAGVRAAMYGSAATVLYGGVASAGNAVATMGNYDEQINKIRKVMNPLSGDIKVVSEAAKQMGKEFGVSVIDSASAMQMYASMGKNASAIIGESRVAILATNVSTLTLKSAVESLTSTSKQFNIPASDTIRILDSWSKIGATTAVDAERMAKAFSTAGAVAKASGLNFDETTGIISAMGEATMKSGEELGTGLKEILTNIRTPQAIESLQAIGVFMQDANGKLLSSRDALAQVKSRWNDLTDAQRQNIAVQIAGTRHAGDFFVLMQKWERAVDLTASSMLSQGTAMKQNDVVMESLNKKLQQLEASWQSFIVSIGETGAIDGLKHILEFTTKIVDGFTTLDKLTHGVAGGIAGTMAATAAVGATAITYGGWDTISGVAHGAANGIRPGGGRPGGGGGAASKAVSAIASSSGELESLAAMAGMGILQNQTTGHKTVASAIRAKNIEAALQLHQSGAPFGAGLNSPQDMELLALFNRARSRTGTMPSSMPVGASLVAGAPDTAGVDELVPTPAPPDHTTRNRVVRQMGLGLGMMVAPMAINAAYDNYHPDDGHTYDPTRTKLKYATDLSANMGLATMLYHPGGGIKGNIPAIIAGTVGAAKTASDWYGNYQEGSRRQSGEAGGTSKMAELDALTEKIQSTSSDLHDTLEAISNGQAIDPQKLNELRDRLSALSPEFAKISQNSTDLFSALKAGGPVLAKAQELARSEKVSLITSKLSETIGSTDTQKKIEERSKLMVEMTTAQSPGQRMDAQVRLAGVRGDLGASYRGLQAVAGVSGAAGVGSKGVVDTGLIGSVAKLNQMSASDVASSFLGNMIKGMNGGGEIDVKKALGGADAEKALKEGYVQLQEEGPIFRLYDQAEVAHYADEVKKTAADIKAAGGILLKAGDQLKGVPIANPEALASIIGNVTQTANALVNRNNQIMQQTEFISKNILVAARAAQGGDVYGGMGVRATRQSLESFSQIQTKGYAGTTPITIDPNNLRTISEALKDMSGGILRNSTNPNGTSIQGLLSLRSNLFSTMVTGQNMVQRQVGAYIKGGGKNFDSFTQEAGASYAPVAEWLQKQLSSKDGPGSFADFQSIINKAQTARHEGRNDDAAKLEDSALNVAIDKIGLGTRDAIPKLGMEIQKQLGQMGMLSQQAVESLGKEFAFQRDSGKVSNVGEYMASPEVQQVVSTLSGFKDMAGRNLKTERGQLSNLRAAGADNREISEAENTVRELESTFKLLDATLSDLPDRVHMFQAGLRDLSNEMGRMQAGASLGGNSGLTGLSAQQFSVDKLQGAINDLSQRMASGKLSPDAGTQAIQQLSHTMIDVRNAMEITRMQRESLDRGAVQSSVTGSVFARLSIPGSNGAGDFITSKQQQIAESVEKLIHMADGRLSGDGQIKRFTDELVRKLAPALGGVNKSVLALDPGFRKNFLLANPSEQLLTSTLMDQMKKGASAQDIFGHPMLREAARNSPLISEVMDQFIKSDTESPQRIVELQTEMLGYQKSLPEIAAKMSEFLDKINPPAAAATAPKMSSGSMAMAGKSSAVDSKGRINKDGTMAVLHEGEIVLNKRQSQELLANHFASGTAPGKRFDSILGVGTESRKFTGTTSEVVGVEMARQDFLRRAWGMGLDHNALDMVSKNYKVGGVDSQAHAEVDLGRAAQAAGKVGYVDQPSTTHIATTGRNRFTSGVIGEEAFHLLDRQHLENAPMGIFGEYHRTQVNNAQRTLHMLINHPDSRVKIATRVVAERYPKFKDAFTNGPDKFIRSMSNDSATMSEMSSEIMGKLLQMSTADNTPIPKDVLGVMKQYTRSGGVLENAVRSGADATTYKKLFEESLTDIGAALDEQGVPRSVNHNLDEHGTPRSVGNNIRGQLYRLFGIENNIKDAFPHPWTWQDRWSSLRKKNILRGTAHGMNDDIHDSWRGKHTPDSTKAFIEDFLTPGGITEGRVNVSPFGNKRSGVNTKFWMNGLDDPEFEMLPRRKRTAKAVATPVVPPVEKAVVGFKTTHGSKYTISGSTTQRNKAPHAHHDPTDVGPKQPSSKTVYVTPEAATEVGMWQTSSAEGKSIILRDGHAILLSRGGGGGEPGKIGTDGKFGFKEEPEVGLHPLELFNPSHDIGLTFYRGNHPGSEITELFTEEAVQPAATVAFPSGHEVEMRQFSEMGFGDSSNPQGWNHAATLAFNQKNWAKKNAKLERGTRVKRAQAGLDYDNFNEGAAGGYSRYGGYDPGVTPNAMDPILFEGKRLDFHHAAYTPVGSNLPFDYYNPAYGKAMPKSRAASRLSIPWQSKLPMWMRNSGYAVGESWAKTRKPFKMAVGGAVGLGVGLAITELALPMAARATLGQTGEDAYHGGVRPMLNHAMQAQFYGHLAKGGGLLTEQLETKAIGDAVVRRIVEKESAILAAKAGIAEATPEMAQQAFAKVGMVRRGLYGFGNVTSDLMAGKGFAERAIPSLGGRSLGGLASPMMAMTVASLVAKTPEYVRKIGGYWNKDWARDDTYGADATRFGEAAGNIISAPIDLAMHYATLGYVGEGLHVGNYKEVVGQHKDELNKLEGNWADRTVQGFMDTGAAFGKSGDETAGAALLTYHQSLRMDAETSTSQTMNELFNKPFLMSVTPQKFEELYPSAGGGTATVDPLADRIAKIDDTLKVLNPDTSKGGGGLINSLKASLDRSRGTLGESDVASARKQIEELESKREKLTKMKSFLLTKSHEGLGRYGNYKSKADMFLLNESLKSNPHAYSVLMDAAARHSFFDVSRVLTDAGDDRGKALLKDKGALQSWRQLAVSDPTQTIGDMVQAVSASIGKSQQEDILDTSKHGKDAQWMRYFSASNISKAALESSRKNAFQDVSSSQETSGFIATALDSVSQFLPLITDDKGPYKTYVSDYHRAEEHMAAVVAQAHGGVLDYGPYSTGVDPNVILKAAGSYGYLKSSIDQDVAKTSTEHDAARKALEGVYLGYTSLPESDRGVVTRRLVEGGVLSDPNKEIKSVKDIVDVWPSITDLTQGDGMMQVTGWDKKAREDYNKWSLVAEMRTAVNEAKQKARYGSAQSDQQKSLYSAMQTTGANYDSVVISGSDGTQSFSDRLKISKSGDQDGSLRYQNDLLQYRAQLDYYRSLSGEQTPLDDAQHMFVGSIALAGTKSVDSKGRIREDGTPAILHQGEVVLNRSQSVKLQDLNNLVPTVPGDVFSDDKLDRLIGANGSRVVQPYKHSVKRTPDWHEAADYILDKTRPTNAPDVLVDDVKVNKKTPAAPYGTVPTAAEGLSVPGYEAGPAGEPSIFVPRPIVPQARNRRDREPSSYYKPSRIYDKSSPLADQFVPKDLFDPVNPTVPFNPPAVAAKKPIFDAAAMKQGAMTAARVASASRSQTPTTAAAAAAPAVHTPGPADIFLQPQMTEKEERIQTAKNILENRESFVPEAAAVAAPTDTRTPDQKFDDAEYAKTMSMSPQELWKSQVEWAGKFGIQEDELLHDQLEKKASAAAGKRVDMPMVKGLHRSWSQGENGSTKEMYEFEKNGKKILTEAGKAFEPLPTKNADGTQNLDNIETNNSLSGVGVLPKPDDTKPTFGTAATAAGQAASKSEALKLTNPGRESIDREPLVRSAYATNESPNADSLHADMQALITELRNEHGGSGGSMTHSGEVTLKVGDDVQAFLKQLTAIVNGGNTETPQVGYIIPKPNTQTQ